MVVLMEGEKNVELDKRRLRVERDRERKGWDLFGYKKTFNWSCVSHMTKDTKDTCQFLMVPPNPVLQKFMQPRLHKILAIFLLTNNHLPHQQFVKNVVN